MVEWRFLQGYLRKTVSKTWCFGGEFVVDCVVSVVVCRPLFCARKMCHVLQIYFGACGLTFQLLQGGVLLFGGKELRQVGIGVFPGDEESFVSLLRFGFISGHRVGAC